MPSRAFVERLRRARTDRLALVSFSQRRAGGGRRCRPSRGFDKARVMAERAAARCPAAARSWWKASIVGWDELRAGSARASSRACGSSCCSPTARRTASPGRTTGIGGVAVAADRRISPSAATTPTARRGIQPRPSPGSTTPQSGASVPVHRESWPYPWNSTQTAHAAQPLLPLTRPGTRITGAGRDRRRLVSRCSPSSADRSTAAPAVAASAACGAGTAARAAMRRTMWNINNAARNVVEQHRERRPAPTRPATTRIRIYTIGMGNLVRLQLGTRPETSESMLKRIANDPTSPDHNAAQIEGSTTTRRRPTTSPPRSTRCRTRSFV